MTTTAGGPIWLDGALVPHDQASVHVLSHGMQRGSTVFDVLRVVNTAAGPAAFGLREHVARFCRSMELMGMDAAYGVGALEDAVREAVAANPGANVVKLAGVWSEIPLRSLPVSTVPSIYVAAITPDATVDPGGTKSSVKLKTATAPKMPAEVLPPSLKVAASYTAGVRERLAAVAEGFDDVIFRTVKGDLAEGTTQSLFVIREGKILLPPLDQVLDGITRRAVLDVALHAGVVADVRSVWWDEVETADELFLCSTNTPVLPVVQHDERVIDGPGPVSKQLADAMDSLLNGSHELSHRWITPLR